jgi:hypothetical protein
LIAYKIDNTSLTVVRIVGYNAIAKHSETRNKPKCIVGRRLENQVTERMVVLLKTWCDALIELQLDHRTEASLDGGIMCPACCRIHGRCADAVLPLLYLGKATDNSLYTERAIQLQAWADSVRFADGSWNNESASYVWKYTSVFSAIGIALALINFQELLPPAVSDRWSERLFAALAFLYDNLTIDTGTINYPISCAAAFAVAGSLYDDTRYRDRASELVAECMTRLTEPNYLPYGEGHPADCYRQGSDKSVDVGYNVEESLPNLLLYALHANDSAAVETVVRSLEHHMPFLLPDGAWDSSWGTRSYKWTYWGSRTTDGSGSLFRAFSDVSERYRSSLVSVIRAYEANTHHGLLLGGPHYASAGQRVCVHHTFCHAKGLAQALMVSPIEGELLSRAREVAAAETSVGESVISYPETHTWVVRRSAWRATVTAYDTLYVAESHPSGGALSLLWHESVGPLVAASPTRTSFAKEADNLQINWTGDNECLTPRIETVVNGSVLSNTNDLSSTVRYDETEQEILFEVSGYLADGGSGLDKRSEIPFELHYTFGPERCTIRATGFPEYESPDVWLVLPVISQYQVAAGDDAGMAIEISVGNGEYVVRADSTMALSSIRPIFNQIPGFMAQELRYPVPASGVRVAIEVEKRPT